MKHETVYALSRFLERVLRAGNSPEGCELLMLLGEELQEAEQPSIVCPKCGRRSFHPKDIAELFCGACGFHDSFVLIAVALPEQVPKPEGALTFWVIFDHPRDVPHAFVLRPQFVVGTRTFLSSIAWYADDPEKLRGILPFGATFMGRQEGDDPAILEVWME